MQRSPMGQPKRDPSWGMFDVDRSQEIVFGLESDSVEHRSLFAIQIVRRDVFPAPDGLP
jgi:hypothetical protein